MSLTGCMEVDNTSQPTVQCKYCYADNLESNVEEYHDVLLHDYKVIRAVSSSKVSASIEGDYDADGFLVFYNANGHISGSVQQTETYTFFYETNDGGWKKDSVPADMTTIYPSDETPHVKYYTEYGDWFICQKCEKTNYRWAVNFWRLYVPKTSITNEYVID